MADPFIPWMGGKSRLADRILPLIPAHTCYVEPFAGGAAIFFRKAPSECEVLNDVNGELVNLYRVVQHHLEEFCKQFKYELISRQRFEWHKLAAPETLTDIQRAARFFYLQKTAFGGKSDGQSFGTTTTTSPKFNLMRVEQDLSMAHIRLSGATIEHLDWQEVVEKYDRPHTVFFMDPPYWDTQGYGVEFGREQYDEMASLARSIEGKMIITVNDHPEMQRAFAGLPMEAVGITYSVGGGANSQAAQELIIRNREDGFGGNLSLL